MDSQQKQIEELEASIAIDQQNLKIMKAQSIIYLALDEWKKQFGDNLEEIVVGYFGLDYHSECSSDSSSLCDTDTENEELLAMETLADEDGKPKYSKTEKDFYRKHKPKRKYYKFGYKGISKRKDSRVNPYSFDGWSWWTKTRVHKVFPTESLVRAYAKGFWNKYPSEI